jgi:hypothetical protein
MGWRLVGLLVAFAVGVGASRGLAWVGFDPERTVPVALAAGAIAAWPFVRTWWGGSLGGWAARWVLAATLVLALTHWGCPAAW